MRSKEFFIIKNADPWQGRYLASVDVLASEEDKIQKVTFEARKAFWADTLPKQAGPNPNIRIASIEGAVILGYVALKLPDEEQLGKIRPGLNIVINPRFRNCIDVAPALTELGDRLCPAEAQVNTGATTHSSPIQIANSEINIT